LLQWFRQHGYLQDGKYADLESFVKGDWENHLLVWDANDLLTLINTWFHGNIAMIKDKGDLAQALNSIKAKGLIMPAKTDLYFPVSSYLPPPGI
jgi:homoserine acetyltransferase